MKISIDFPDAVHEALRAAASAQGLSLNTFVVALLEAEQPLNAPPQFVTQEFV
jgi:predicted HicB family RNase H-like nuclease